MRHDSYRRIAQRQSASKHTEEVAAFNSCSAYQNSPSLLFLSHCVPNPPDKGERIRAHHELMRLAAKYPVHLVCFARTDGEVEDALALDRVCASVYVEALPQARQTARAMAGFAMGRSLTASFYSSAGMQRHIAGLRVTAAVAYSSVMGAYVPDGIPLVTDMVDVDSEKWFQYGAMRFPGALYRLEGKRLRQLEKRIAARSAATFFSTRREAALLRPFTPAADIRCFENGVDFDYFDPDSAVPASACEGKPTVAFVGEMSYFPNAEAVCRFARTCLPELRRLVPGAEFAVVGRRPTAAVRKLKAIAGVRVTGGVPDVRPYLRAAAAVVAPLELARGIQNKVLEALAMGKRVFASPAVCATFAPDLPSGVVRCESASEYASAIAAELGPGGCTREEIRRDARRRFSWERNLNDFAGTVESAIASRMDTAPVRA